MPGLAGPVDRKRNIAVHNQSGVDQADFRAELEQDYWCNSVYTARQTQVPYCEAAQAAVGKHRIGCARRVGDFSAEPADSSVGIHSAFQNVGCPEIPGACVVDQEKMPLSEDLCRGIGPSELWKGHSLLLLCIDHWA